MSKRAAQNYLSAFCTILDEAVQEQNTDKLDTALHKLSALAGQNPEAAAKILSAGKFKDMSQCTRWAKNNPEEILGSRGTGMLQTAREIPDRDNSLTAQHSDAGRKSQGKKPGQRVIPRHGRPATSHATFYRF